MKPKDYSSNPSMLKYPECVVSLQPLSRFFHAAALIKDTMVIVGGRTEAEDYSNSVSLYQINCNTWIQPGNQSVILCSAH